MRRTAWLLSTVLLTAANCDRSSGRLAEGRAAAEPADPEASAGEYRPPRDVRQMDPCALLQPAEIPARFGQVSEGPTRSGGTNSWPSCSYVLAPNTGLVVELLESQWYDMNRNGWDPARVQDVDGIGDKAFIVSLKPPADPHLVAAKDDVAIKVTTRNLELAREAARIVLGKL